MPTLLGRKSRLACLLVACCGLAPTEAVEEGFRVNSTADAIDAKPNGVCETAAGECTLRAAVMEANALAGADAILLPPGTITLTIAPVPDSGGDYVAQTGDLEITDALTIQGAGPGLTTVDGGGLDRIFEVGLSAEVTIQGLTLRNGSSEGGGAVLNYGTLGLAHCEVRENAAHNWGGGGISNWSGAQLTVDDCVITQNAETNSGGGGIASAGTLTVRHSLVDGNEAAWIGGGISSDYPGTLVLEDSTVSNNQSLAPAAYLYYGGGGISSNGTLTIRNSTISGNSAVFSGGGGLQNIGTLAFLTNVTISGNSAATAGGGIWSNFSGGTMWLSNCTVAGNTAATGGGIGGAGGMPPSTTNLVATMVANNTGGNCAGVVLSAAPYHNLDSGSSCGFTEAGDLAMTDPLLAPLADNGGPVATHALTAASPAIDGADPLECVEYGGLPLVSDARGAARPLDGGTGSAVCDIGAYEHFTGMDLIFADGFDG